MRDVLCVESKCKTGGGFEDCENDQDSGLRESAILASVICAT